VAAKRSSTLRTLAAEFIKPGPYLIPQSFHRSFSLYGQSLFILSCNQDLHKYWSSFQSYIHLPSYPAGNKGTTCSTDSALSLIAPAIKGRSAQTAKQGNAMEDTSGEDHWETHDTRIALCKYAGIVLSRLS
jgi:hypothetical protein